MKNKKKKIIEVKIYPKFEIVTKDKNKIIVLFK